MKVSHICNANAHVIHQIFLADVIVPWFLCLDCRDFEGGAFFFSIFVLILDVAHLAIL